jgi:hypothetical protein
VTTNDNRFGKAIEAFDNYHRKDPNIDTADGKEYPSEFLYAQRMTARLSVFAPDAAEVIQLAARCQHIGRWEIPREKYSPDKKGYLQWRNEEKFHHARIAESILLEAGYGQDVIEKVKSLLLKKELFTNADTQLLEDVVCLVFVEHYLADFSAKHPDEKVVDILQKTLRKMSKAGKDAVTTLPLSYKLRSLFERAMTSG